MIRFGVVLAACVLIAGCSWIIGRHHPPGGRVFERESVTAINLARPGEAPRMFPNVGNIARATAYYGQISTQLGIPDFQSWTLRSVAEFLGYPTLEFRADPCSLMVQGGRSDILAFRYFAPKTSTLVSTGQPQDVGWRTAMRLRARDGSRASVAGIASAFVLANFQQPAAELRSDPFARPADYFQVALLRREARENFFPTYFILFGPDGSLRVSTTATFFGGDATVRGHQYYVPDTCLHCHGGNRLGATLNLLDVDHWNDRAATGNDYEVVAQSGRPLTSTGNCRTRPLDVAGQLNREIGAHDRLAMAPPHVQQSVDSWLNKHRRRPQLLSVDQRAYGNNTWDRNRPGDIKLLTLMDRYCYRCHGSIRFDVFDRASVVQRRNAAISAIEQKEMPLDRRDSPLSQEERAVLIALLKDLR